MPEAVWPCGIRLKNGVLVFPCLLSHVWLFVTHWNVAHQAHLYVEFFRQEYWSDCRFLLQEIFPTQGLNPSLLCLLHCSQILSPPEPSGNPPYKKTANISSGLNSILVIIHPIITDLSSIFVILSRRLHDWLISLWFSIFSECILLNYWKKENAQGGDRQDKTKAYISN